MWLYEGHLNRHQINSVCPCHACTAPCEFAHNAAQMGMPLGSVAVPSRHVWLQRSCSPHSAVPLHPPTPRPRGQSPGIPVKDRNGALGPGTHWKAGPGAGVPDTVRKVV